MKKDLTITLISLILSLILILIFHVLIFILIFPLAWMALRGNRTGKYKRHHEKRV